MFICRFGIAGLLVCVLLLSPMRATAQSEEYVVALSTPDVNSFPQISVYLDVHDSAGNFLHGLTAEQVSIIEDGNALPVAQIKELQPGAQLVVAINPGQSFAIRNNKAISRYDLVKTKLRAWARSRLGSNLDDWSLLITNGPSISHVADPARWLEAFDEDQSDSRTYIPDLDVLARSISLAADPTIRPGMGRAVLFITAPLENATDQVFEDLTTQAQQHRIAIFVWMVASPGALTTRSAEQLRGLAEKTHGQFFPFTGDEELPSPEVYLTTLRPIYWMSYHSKVTSAGQHQIMARVLYSTVATDSEIQSYEINIQPPQPALVSPPFKIVRTPPEEDGSDSGAEANVLLPDEQLIQVVFDFPDGRKREIVNSILYINGEAVDENRQAPFDQFTWDLSAYTNDSVVQLRVQATDDLGLTGSTIEVPVQISVEYPPSDNWNALQKTIPLLATLATLLAGAILLLVLLLGGKLRPVSWRVSRARRRFDPLTQPVVVQNEPSGRKRSSWMNRFQLNQRQATPEAFALLTPISDADDPSALPPIPIHSNEVTIGRDPTQATLILDDPSIEALHARLVRENSGNFRLRDEGSLAGTWVNYTPISREGLRLEHGDLIHIGRIGFRFSMRQALQIRRPVIKPEVSSEDTAEELPQ